MSTVLLLRGLNVGGHRRLKMADLRGILAALGAGAPRTYLQSGNAVYGGPMLPAAAITAAIADAAGHRPAAIQRSAAGWAALLAGCPFDAPADPRHLHVFLADGAITADLAGRPADRATDETLALAGGALWLHTPCGLGRSKLAAKLERLAGCPQTGRNWRTIHALAEMAG